jgi:PIN domain nuclease of toxin-antitoxin system
MAMLLTDTHALIWFAADDHRLSRAARAALVDPQQEVFVSVVCYWEIEVKRLRSSEFSPPEPVRALMDRAGFRPLGMDFDVPVRLAGLPRVHGDPFDRMLVAQALHHGLTLVTGDRALRRYPVPTLW